MFNYKYLILIIIILLIFIFNKFLKKYSSKNTINHFTQAGEETVSSEIPLSIDKLKNKLSELQTKYNNVKTEESSQKQKLNTVLNTVIDIINSLEETINKLGGTETNFLQLVETLNQQINQLNTDISNLDEYNINKDSELIEIQRNIGHYINIFNFISTKNLITNDLINFNNKQLYILPINQLDNYQIDNNQIIVKNKAEPLNDTDQVALIHKDNDGLHLLKYQNGQDNNTYLNNNTIYNETDKLALPSKIDVPGNLDWYKIFGYEVIVGKGDTSNVQYIQYSRQYYHHRVGMHNYNNHEGMKYHLRWRSRRWYRRGIRFYWYWRGRSYNRDIHIRSNKTTDTNKMHVLNGIHTMGFHTHKRRAPIATYYRNFYGRYYYNMNTSEIFRNNTFLNIKLKTAQNACAYVIKQRPKYGQTPRNWFMYARINNGSWVQIDQQINITEGDWNNSHNGEHVFFIDNPGTYDEYAICFTNSNRNKVHNIHDYLSFAQFSLLKNRKGNEECNKVVIEASGDGIQTAQGSFRVNNSGWIRKNNLTVRRNCNGDSSNNNEGYFNVDLQIQRFEFRLKQRLYNIQGIFYNDRWHRHNKPCNRDANIVIHSMSLPGMRTQKYELENMSRSELEKNFSTLQQGYYLYTNTSNSYNVPSNTKNASNERDTSMRNFLSNRFTFDNNGNGFFNSMKDTPKGGITWCTRHKANNWQFRTTRQLKRSGAGCNSHVFYNQAYINEKPSGYNQNIENGFFKNAGIYEHGAVLNWRKYGKGSRKTPVFAWRGSYYYSINDYHNQLTAIYKHRINIINEKIDNSLNDIYTATQNQDTVKYKQRESLLQFYKKITNVKVELIKRNYDIITYESINNDKLKTIKDRNEFKFIVNRTNTNDIIINSEGNIKSLQNYLTLDSIDNNIKNKLNKIYSGSKISIRKLDCSNNTINGFNTISSNIKNKLYIKNIPTVSKNENDNYVVKHNNDYNEIKLQETTTTPEEYKTIINREFLYTNFNVDCEVNEEDLNFNERISIKI